MRLSLRSDINQITLGGLDFAFGLILIHGVRLSINLIAGGRAETQSGTCVG